MTLAAKKMKTVTLHTKTYVTIIRQERGGDTFLFKITPKKSTIWHGLILQNIPSILRIRNRIWNDAKVLLSIIYITDV